MAKRDISLQCACGNIQGSAKNIGPNSGIRIVCYCDSCQAFANYLSREYTSTSYLDNYGGTDIFQLTPDKLKITSGQNDIARIKLTEKGLHRWYAKCCGTPIGNTVSAALPFVGLINSFMNHESDRTSDLGPVRYYVQAQSALSSPPTSPQFQAFPIRMLFTAAPIWLWAKIRGREKPSPFYHPDGKPIANAKVLS